MLSGFVWRCKDDWYLCWEEEGEGMGVCDLHLSCYGETRAKAVRRQKWVRWG